MRPQYVCYNLISRNSVCEVQRAPVRSGTFPGKVRVSSNHLWSCTPMVGPLNLEASYSVPVPSRSDLDQFLTPISVCSQRRVSRYLCQCVAVSDTEATTPSPPTSAKYSRGATESGRCGASGFLVLQFIGITHLHGIQYCIPATLRLRRPSSAVLASQCFCST